MAFPDGWTRKCKITIPDAQISGSNTDFPIVLTASNFPPEMLDGGANSALNGGGDVRFSDDSAGMTRLACEIVICVTGGSPAAEIWVKLSSLNTGADREFYVWYHKAGETQPVVTAPYGRNAVWSNAEVVVLMEDATPIDHTGNHTLSIAGTLTNIAGPFGNANAFSGSDRLSTTDVALRDILATYDTTVSVIAKKASDANSKGALSWDGSDDFILYTLENDGTPTLGVRAFWRDISGINTMYINNVAAAQAWGWTAFTTRASNDHELYQNGASGITKSSTGSVGPFTAFYIGGWGPTSQNFDGDIAQVIVWKTARTSNWLTTEYNNQSSPTAFASAGMPEAVGSGFSLVLQGAAHAIVSDNIASSQSHNLSLTAANHSLTSENALLSLGQAILLQDAGHGLASDMAILSQIQVQAPAGSSHNMSGDNVILSQGYGLAIGDARQEMLSDDVTFAQLQALLVQNATHGLGSDQVVVIDPTAFTPSPGRTLKATGKSRILTPNAGDRTTQPINI